MHRVYQLINTNEIEHVDSETKAVLDGTGSKEFAMIGEGLNDEGEREMMCVDHFENSIWLKDHKDPNPKKKTIKRMEFIGGQCKVDKSLTKDIKMLSKWAANEEAPALDGVTRRFKYIDGEKIAEEGLSKEDDLIEAKYLVKNADMKQIHAFIAYRNLPVSGFDSERQLRHSLMVKLDRDSASRFVKDFKSERVATFYDIKVALDMGVIALDTRSSNVVWAESKNVILSYKGQNAIEALTNYALGSTEGKIFYQKLTLGNEISTGELSSSSNVDLTVDQMVKLAIEQKVLQPNSEGMFYFGGSKCGSDVDAVIKHIGDRPKKIEELKELLKL